MYSFFSFFRKKYTFCMVLQSVLARFDILCYSVCTLIFSKQAMLLHFPFIEPTFTKCDTKTYFEVVFRQSTLC